MALCTGYTYVLSIKFKGCFIVIKPHSLPVFRSMAIGAVCNAIFCKLPVMVIFMTGSTAH
jgi:hypothetical protein